MKSGFRLFVLGYSISIMVASTGCNKEHDHDTMKGGMDNAAMMSKDLEDLKAVHAASKAPLIKDPQNASVDAFCEAHYAPDAISIAPNMKPVIGRDSIAAMLKSWGQLTKFSAVDDEVWYQNGTATILGTYEVEVKMPNGKPMFDKGHYMEIWQKQPDGKWRCIRDISASEKTPMQGM